ncbi:hypothetical protein ACS0TY_011252 [Phlomoides rotata]
MSSIMPLTMNLLGFRTKTLMKSAIVHVDPAHFKQWYLRHYSIELGKKTNGAVVKEETEEGETAAQETKKRNYV